MKPKTQSEILRANPSRVVFRPSVAKKKTLQHYFSVLYTYLHILTNWKRTNAETTLYPLNCLFRIKVLYPYYYFGI